jgi:hypothetical protein
MCSMVSIALSDVSMKKRVTMKWYPRSGGVEGDVRERGSLVLRDGSYGRGGEWHLERILNGRRSRLCVDGRTNGRMGEGRVHLVWLWLWVKEGNVRRRS